MVRAFLVFGLLALCSAQSASAASVAFQGFFNQNIVGGGTGSLGAVPPAISFGSAPPTLRNFSFTDGAGTQALTAPTTLTLGVGGPLWILGGTATLTDAGVGDNALFVLNVSTVSAASPQDGTLSLSFSGDLFDGGSAVSQANFDQLINEPFYNRVGSITYVDQSTATLNIYGGLATAVPEPGSAAALLCLGIGCIVRRRRSA